MMLNLLYEGGRDWSVNEILSEYQNRGTPVEAKDPSNALRAAVAEANRAGTIVRTAPGRYRAADDPSGVMSQMAQDTKDRVTGGMDVILSGGPHPGNQGEAAG